MMPEAMASTNYQDDMALVEKKRAMEKMASQQAELPSISAEPVGAEAAPEAAAGKMTGAQSGMAMAGKAIGQEDALSGAASGALSGAAVGGPVGAVVGGVIGAAKGLFSQKAQAEARRRKAVIDSMAARMKGEQQASEQLSSGSRAATQSMMQGFGRALS